jgi:Cellulase N-terminal ig-like domain
MIRFARLFMLLTAFFLSTKVYTQGASIEIRLNQEGFYTSSPKIAILVGEARADIFFVINIVKRDTVFSGIPGKN